ncbi:hypothetical protein [Burkholderia sp. THE68]|uniref:dTMP kinase n=1 Tax=Burkholderia sp. THE68 TaxID=758782 RepID=UPI00138A4686
MKSNKGKLVTLEGVDGAGKSSSVQFIKDVLEGLGYHIVVTREPGGCALSEEIRAMVLRRPMSLDRTLTLRSSTGRASRGNDLPGNRTWRHRAVRQIRRFHVCLSGLGAWRAAWESHASG